VTPTTDLAVDEIQPGMPEFWARPDRDGMFAKLRAERPVAFHEEPQFADFPKGPGFWSVTRYADVVRVARDSETFQSGKGTNIGDLPVELLEFFGSMINMGAQAHEAPEAREPRLHAARDRVARGDGACDCAPDRL
jgi:cytochrome P450